MLAMHQEADQRNAWQVKKDLASAYQIFAHLGWDDLTYTHLSARVPGEDTYYIYPFGLLFEEVTPGNLLRVTLEGQVLEGEEYQYNQTGYTIHSGIYKNRTDINAIFHLHTPAGIAVSVLKEGLLPISQFSLHFFNRHSYHAYDSLALGAEQGQRLQADLGFNKVMFLRNHGTLTAGSTIQEAFFYAYYLEKACQTQVMACGMGKEVILPDAQTAERAAREMRGFEADLGRRDWLALLRKIEQKQI